MPVVRSLHDPYRQEVAARPPRQVAVDASSATVRPHRAGEPT